MPTIRPPLTSVTPHNQTGIIAILAGFALGLLLLSIPVRLYARRNAGAPRSDDGAFYLGVVCGLGQIGGTLALVSRGLGRSVEALDAGAVRGLQRGALATAMGYLGTLFFSKASCGIMFVWLTPFEGQRRAAWTLVAACAGWVVAALLAEGVGCGDLLGRCAGYRTRWVCVAVGDVVLEVLLVGASVYMVWSRSMSRRAKCSVVGAFSCRLPNIALALARLVFLLGPSPTTAIHISRVQATTQLAVGYTIVSCVIPYLRPLMQSYESDGTGLGRTAATFSFSDRSRESKGSRELKGLGLGEAGGKGKAKAAGSTGTLELNDVSRLLGPGRPGFVRLKSTETVERASRQVV